MKSRHWLRLVLFATLISPLTACDLFEPEPTTYSLVHEIRDDATGSHLRLWHYSEGILDAAGYFLEVIENDQPVRPNVGESIIWLDGTASLPTLKREAGCYVLAVTSVNYATRFEQKHWLLAFLFGSGVDLKAGDTWNRIIAQRPVCFRFEK